MIIKKEDLNYPILLGYPTSDTKQLAVWCPYCVRYHKHGREEGHRVAHCVRADSPFKKTGYIIMKANNTQLNFKNKSTKKIDRIFSNYQNLKSE